MPNIWKTYKLGELVDVKQGLAINKKTNHLLTDKSSMPLFKIRDLINNTVEHYVKENEVPKQCIANYEDLIYSRTGQVGLVFRGKTGCIHNNCFKIIPDENLINKDLLFWFLKQPTIVEYANNIASGSVQKDLNHTAFKSIEIAIPKIIEEQKSIAEIFTCIDDKITNNLAINKTLEEMAMALYKHWFIDFGPFQDEEFVESELGFIPKGWEVKNFFDLFSLLSGGTPKTSIAEYWNGNINWVSAKDIGSNNSSFYINDTEKKVTDLGIKKSAAKILPEDTIIVVARGSVGKYGMLTKPMAINQSCYGIYSKSNYSQPVTYLLIQSLMNHFMQVSYGSVFDTITTSTFQNINILLPPESILNEIKNNIDEYFTQIKQNVIENQTLIKLRDTLLPKLISGEIRLK